MIKLCAYINVLLTNINNDKMFYYFVDVIEPMLIGDMNYDEYVTYTMITEGQTMNTLAAYKKSDGMYGIDRVLVSDKHTHKLCSIKGQWTTLQGAINKMAKLTDKVNK